MRFLPSLLYCLAFGLAFAVPAGAQSVVTGIVLAGDTSDPLGAATIQIDDTYVGTVANADGRFSLEVSEFPASITVRFVGYASETRTLTGPPSSELRFVLSPVPYQLSEIVVSSEDPAVGIMRRVIAKKQERRERLQTLTADAYNRFTVENDTGIVSIAEGLSEFLWDRERGGREVVTATRKTDNLDFTDFLPAAMFITNLYDDDIDVMGHNLMGITHPKAISMYNFRLVSTTQQEGRDVYTIRVDTWSKLSTGFEGTITVADQDDTLLSVDLQPNDTFLFPPPFQNVTAVFSQQYLPFADDQWLPADFRSRMSIDVGIPGVLDFPVITINQFSRLSDYEVNVALPDSVFEEKGMVRVDSVQVAQDELLDQPGRSVPLTEVETVAYASIDSTDTIEEAFAPGGVLGRAARLNMDDGDGDEAGSRGGGAISKLNLSPDLGYNRVEGLSPALSARIGRDIQLYGRFGRAFGLEENAYGYGARVRRDGYRLEVGWDKRVRTTYASWTRSRVENSLAFVLGAQDYFDYYRSERLHGKVTVPDRGAWPEVTVGVTREDASGAPQTSDWQLLKDEPVLSNPALPSTRVGAFEIGLEWGEKPDPFGIVGLNWARFDVEIAQSGFLGSDHNFLRGRMLGTWSVNTFYRRRFVPPALQVHLNVGVSRGELPYHRLWTVDGSNRASKPGSLRTLFGRPLTGDKTAFIGWEHNFRTVPFERLGLRGLVRRNLGIILYGGHGRSWLREENRPGSALAGLAPTGWPLQVPDNWHHEVGASLNGLFGMLRLDLTRRLDSPEWALGFGVAKLF